MPDQDAAKAAKAEKVRIATEKAAVLKAARAQKLAAALPKAAPPPSPPEEKRMDGDLGPFTKAEFFGEYAGYAEWEAAEARMDGHDGPFTKAEFFDLYGGYKEWDAACKSGASAARTPPAPSAPPAPTPTAAPVCPVAPATTSKMLAVLGNGLEEWEKSKAKAPEEAATRMEREARAREATEAAEVRLREERARLERAEAPEAQVVEQGDGHVDGQGEERPALLRMAAGNRRALSEAHDVQREYVPGRA